MMPRNRFVRFQIAVVRLAKRLPLLHCAAAGMALLFYQHLTHLYNVEATRSAAERVTVALVRTESSQRGFLLTANDTYLDDYRYYRRILDMRLAWLCHLLPADEQNRYVCSHASALITEKLAEMERTVQLAQSGHVEEALAVVRTNRGLQLTREIEAALSDLNVDEGHSHGACDGLPK